MKILFVVIFVLSSQLIYTVASDQQLGYNPYPFGTTLLCLAIHPLLLISCIFYLGWIFGIIAFLAHLFGIVHATFSWVLDIPTLLVKNDRQLIRLMKFKIGLLTPTLLANIAFTIISLFFGEHKSLLNTLQGNTTCLIVIAIVAIVMAIVRMIVAKCMADN